MTDQIADIYQQDLLDEYRHPYQKTKLAKSDISADFRNASCGDDVLVELAVEPRQPAEESLIITCAWQGQGCVMSQVASSRLARLCQGKSLKTVLSWQTIDLPKLLNLSVVTPSRMRCVSLSLVAVKQGVEQWLNSKR